ncbi:alkaline phosphatase [Desulfovibrio sp. OttesenSCG-928-I05]|nr:alkaline phosphatase [Desulfovibrio sp. OttesenSCG-928-I05]
MKTIHIKRYILIFSALVILASVLTTIFLISPPLKETGGRNNPQNYWSGAAPKYVFMFIGDGMGPNHIAITETALKSRLSFTSFDNQGIISTHSANKLVTDSAAAATALATGYKTKNGRLGLGPEKQRLTNIAELSKKAGKRVGIITTVSLNHATPAAYYSHVKSRSRSYEIGMAMLTSGFDYFAGGGLHKHDEKGKADLYTVAERQGFTILRDRQVILQAMYQGSPILALNPELGPDSAMPYRVDMTEKSLTLAEFVRKGCELLDSKDGFFMVVEGGKIDWAAHGNQADKMIQEVFDFSEAVDAAIKFAATHPSETLIVVTADHETGGLAWMTPNRGDSTPVRLPDAQARANSFENTGWAWTTKGHTSAMVDVFATGLGSALFRGRYDNTDIAWKLINIMRLQK